LSSAHFCVRGVSKSSITAAKRSHAVAPVVSNMRSVRFCPAVSSL
jgi:hypothetical protein